MFKFSWAELQLGRITIPSNQKAGHAAAQALPQPKYLQHEAVRDWLSVFWATHDFCDFVS